MSLDCHWEIENENEVIVSVNVESYAMDVATRLANFLQFNAPSSSMLHTLNRTVVKVTVIRYVIEHPQDDTSEF